jgi:branched-chain amino acid transport system ATP-binding protein
VLVEQNVHFAAELADRHYLVESGRVAQGFDRAALAADFHRVAARLGV